MKNPSADQPTDRRLRTRRAVLGLVGAGVASLAPGVGGPLAAAPARTTKTPACVVRPEQTQGPYFVDERLRRSDIRVDLPDGSPTPGAPLRLTFRVSRIDARACAPLSGAIVDVWQCDALGVYSGVRDVAGRFDTRGKQFLRGYQSTGDDGVARFLTIYPGWYPGRTVHIHFKIRSDPAARSGHEFSSQLYFDDALTDRVHAHPPYARHGLRRTRNADDGIFRDGGERLVLRPARGTGEDGDDRYWALFDIALRLPHPGA